MAAPELTSMRRWSRWMSAWTVLSLPGLCLAVIAWGPGTMVAVAAVLSVHVGVTLVLLKYGPKQRTRPRGAWWTARFVLCVISLLISMAGIAAATALGPALVVAVVSIATTPPMVDVRRRVLSQIDSARTAPEPGETTDREQPTPPQPPVEAARTMTDRQLCQAWRRSYWTLKDERDPIEKLRLVEQRTRLLDELEARNAAALGAWLASGARACDGPDKFFNDDERDQPTAA